MGHRLQKSQLWRRKKEDIVLSVNVGEQSKRGTFEWALATGLLPLLHLEEAVECEKSFFQVI
jgi:hypothetical protein